MSIFSKIFRTLESGAMEMGEPVVDANAIAIFERDLKEAKLELSKMREVERQLVGKKKQAEVQYQQIQQQVEATEKAALQALEEQNDTLALDLAGKLVQFQGESTQARTLFSRWVDSHEKLLVQIKQMEAQLNDMTHQLNQVKATDIVHQAQEKLHGNSVTTSSSVSSAKQSLERIKARQAETTAFHDVAAEINDIDRLSSELDGDNSDDAEEKAQEILARLKKK